MADLVVVNAGDSGKNSREKINLSIMAVNALNKTVANHSTRITTLEQSSGGSGLDPADKAKLDAMTISNGGARFQINKDRVYLGAGDDDVEVLIDNKVGTNGVIGGNKAGGAWFVGNFPNSQIHPDDIVLENPKGGVFASISDTAKFSVRFGTEIISFTKDEYKSLSFISATKDFNADVVQDNLSSLTTNVNEFGLEAPNASHTTLRTTNNVELVGDQIIPNDPAAIAKDKRLITISNAFEIEKSLKEYSDQTFQDRTDIGDIHSFVAGSDLATKLFELKQQVDKNSHSTSTTPTVPVSAGDVPVYSESNFNYIDIANFIQNPTNPGKDITDGQSHYVSVSLAPNKTLADNVDWCWTKEGTPARWYTNSTKTKAVSPKELKAWLNASALIKVKKTGADWFVEDVYIPAGSSTHAKAILSDGSVPMDSSYTAKSDNDVMDYKATDKMIREFRYTVDLDTAGNHPTRAECIAAFKKLPHFEWSKADDFYIQSTSKDKMVLVKYRPAPTTTDEASAGRFWIEVLTEAK